MNAIFTALKNPAVQKVGMGLLGLNTARQGQNQWNQAYAAPDEDQIRDIYKDTQKLITQGTNFQNYSAPLLDANTAEGQNLIRNAAQMGKHGGSAMLALGNRMKLKGPKEMYGAYNQNLTNMIGHQMGLDSRIHGSMEGVDAWRRGGLAQASAGNMAMGRGLMSDFLKHAGKMTGDDWKSGFGAIGNVLGKDGIGGVLKTGAEGLLGGVRGIGNIFR
tara:strand:+ start:112 stop:762 length:651 start_codon:yes stop_codon:yes gene_type:complete